jgi:elongation factor P
MLNYNEIRERKYIVLEGEPYEVVESHVFRKQQRKPVNQTKIRNLITGSIKPYTFHNNDVVDEAELTRDKYTYAFEKFNRVTGHDEYWFHKSNDRSHRLPIDASVIEDKVKFLKPDMEVEALLFDDKIIGVTIPIKMKFKVKSAPPAVKGNTATGANKQVTLETGFVVNTPIFINEGDIIIINTETGQYVERAQA